MKQRRNALLVVKDNVEYKSLVELAIEINNLTKDTNVTICSPVCGSDNFRSDVAKVLDISDIEFLSWPNKKLYFEKSYMALKNLFFYLRNFNKSFSCKQKLFIYMGFSENFVYRLKLENFKIHSFLAIMSGYIMSLLNSLMTKKSKDEKFDIVIFFRSDSSHNIYIYNNFISRNTQVITFLRNVDAVTLKGCFSVPSDFTYVHDVKQKKRLIDLHDVYEYGLVKISDRKSVKKTFVKTDRSLITYATSHPKFVPLENEMVCKIYEILKKRFQNHLQFQIRLHPADKSERYNLPEDVIFFKEDESYITYNVSGREERYFNMDKVEEYYNQIGMSRALISCTSSIFVDAIDIGIPSLIYINDPKFFEFQSLYNREHLKDILDHPAVMLCDDVECIKTLDI